MSSMVIAYALIGIRVDVSSNDFGSHRVAGCEHRFSIDDCNFCPRCGQMVTEETGRFGEYESLYEFREELEDKLSPGWIVAETFNDGLDDKGFFIGYGVSATYSGGHDQGFKSAPLPDTEAVRAALKGLLEPFDLYDDSTFGLHAVLYYS